MPWEQQKALTFASAMVMTACLMLAILSVVKVVDSNTTVLNALATSHGQLVELNQRIGALTDGNTRARRAEAAQWRQLMEFCKSQVVTGPKCTGMPDEATLKILER